MQEILLKGSQAQIWKQLALIFVLVIVATGWFMLDQSIDTRQRIEGEVLYCEGGHHHPRQCAVKVNDRIGQLMVFSNTAHPGDKIVLALFQRRISKQTFYDLAPLE